MKFKVDENLHSSLAVLLRRGGHDAVTVWDEGLRGRPDEDVARAARAEGRVLLTLDLDFADITAYPPEQYPGLIVFRLADQSRPSVLQAAQRLLPMLEKEPVQGTLWVVDESRVRVRGASS